MPLNPSASFSFSRRWALLSAASSTCLLGLLPCAMAQSAGEAKELARRAENTVTAREKIQEGDEAYHAGDYGKAAAAYRAAYSGFGTAPLNREWRDAARERLVQASIEEAKGMSRLGDVEGAKKVVERVLRKEVAPDHPAAMAALAQLNDPIRTNPALTPDHVQDIEEVRTLLYVADGAYQLGKFDQAKEAYEGILRVDPTNRAARRGLEKVAHAKTDAARAGQDRYRAEALAAVEKEWELPIEPAPGELEGLATDLTPLDGKMYLADKLDTIVFPVLDLEQATVTEALDYMRAQSMALDVLTTDPSQKGVNLVLELAGVSEESRAHYENAKISLRLKGVPMSKALEYLCEQAKLVASPEEFAVVLRPVGASVGAMTTKVFSVPPNFLSVANAGGASTEGADDPFGGGSEGVPLRRLSAADVLKAQGVPFPEGASASFNASNSTIRVTNTMDNLQLVQSVVDSLSADTAVMVVTEVKIIRTQLKTLEEVGLDWLLEDFPTGNGGFLSGGANNPENLSDVIVPDSVLARRGITSGNRSGTEAIANNSIDDLIQRGDTVVRGSQRSPGVLTYNGTLNDAAVTAVLRGLNQKKETSTLAMPSAVSRSGEQAVIEVGREFLYPSEYEPPQLPNTIQQTIIQDPDTGDLTDVSAGLVAVTPATPTSFELKIVGTRLDVLPTVSEDRHFIDLTIRPEVIDFDGFVNYGTPVTSPGSDALGNPVSVVVTPNQILMPVFSAMRTQSSVTVQNGATLVLGGLLQDRVEKVQDKTPILGDLPLVGSLFQSNAHAVTKTAVIFLVTTRVVDPAGRPVVPNP